MTLAHELLAMLLLPVLGVALILIATLLAARFRLPAGKRGLCAVLARPETCTLLLWLGLLLYPSVAKMSLTPFPCVLVGGQSLLRADPSVLCGGAEWHVHCAVGCLHLLRACTRAAHQAQGSRLGLIRQHKRRAGRRWCCGAGWPARVRAAC